MSMAASPWSRSDPALDTTPLLVRTRCRICDFVAVLGQEVTDVVRKESGHKESSQIGLGLGLGLGFRGITSYDFTLHFLY